jgi:antitoxin ParD1/3/4
VPTRNIVLTKQQADLVEELVRSGRYQNASEVLRAGLRLLERREAEEDAKLAALRRALEESEAAAGAGDLYDFGPGFLNDIDDEDPRRPGERTG